MAKKCKTPPAISYGSSHHIMELISAGCLGATALITLALVLTHFFRYTVPKEQRPSLRIILTPLIIGAIAAGSVFSYSASEYIMPIGDVYEAFALASLFLMFVEFTGQTGDYSPLMKKRYIFVYQYCIICPIVLIAQDASVAAGTFCYGSMQPHYVNFWVTIIRTISVGAAVITIFRYYKTEKSILSAHRGGKKLLCFKLIVFLDFVQTWIFKILLQTNGIKASDTFSDSDIRYGIPNVLFSAEMTAIALLFHYCYSSSEYSPKHRSSGKLNPSAAFIDALNPSDLFTGAARCFGPVDASYRDDQIDYDEINASRSKPWRGNSPSPAPGAFGRDYSPVSSPQNAVYPNGQYLGATMRYDGRSRSPSPNPGSRLMSPGREMV